MLSKLAKLILIPFIKTRGLIIHNKNSKSMIPNGAGEEYLVDSVEPVIKKTIRAECCFYYKSLRDNLQVHLKVFCPVLAYRLWTFF